MQSLPSNQPLPVLPLEYERTSEEQAAARQLFCKSILIVACGYYLSIAQIGISATARILFRFAGYRQVLAMESVLHVASLTTLVGSWMLLGLDWSGRKRITALAWAARIMLIVSWVLIVVSAVTRNIQFIYRGAIPSNVLWFPYPTHLALQALWTAISVWVLVRSLGVIKAFEGSGSLPLAFSVGFVSLLRFSSIVASWLMYSHRYGRGFSALIIMGLAVMEIVLAIMLTLVAHQSRSHRT
jgi:hypothetical protein